MIKESFILFAVSAGFAIAQPPAPTIPSPTKTMAKPVAATSGAFDRYKIIFQKHPFGAPPPVVVDAPPPMPDNKPNWVNDYRVSMLRETKDGRLQAGLVKKTSNTSILLDVGDRHETEGIELVAVDMASSEVKLKKGSETRSLGVNPEDFKLGGGKPSAKPSTKGAQSFADRMAARRAELMKKSKSKGSPPRPGGR